MAATLLAKSLALRLSPPARGAPASAAPSGAAGASAEYTEQEARADLSEVLREAIWSLGIAGGREPPYVLPRVGPAAHPPPTRP